MADDARSPADWIAAYAAGLGVEPPAPEVVDVLLQLAGVAAHASERTAAPIACWLVGQAGVDPTRALDLAREV